jgi:hypothetical protein
VSDEGVYDSGSKFRSSIVSLLHLLCGVIRRQEDMTSSYLPVLQSAQLVSSVHCKSLGLFPLSLFPLGLFPLGLFAVHFLCSNNLQEALSMYTFQDFL